MTYIYRIYLITPYDNYSFIGHEKIHKRSLTKDIIIGIRLLSRNKEVYV